MAQTIEQALIQFHETYRLVRSFVPISSAYPSGATSTWMDDLWKLRRKLIVEEFNELMEGMHDLHSSKSQDEAEKAVVAIADGICDLVYVAVGTAVSFGIPFDRCFEEVQRSNMSKLGEDGKPIVREDGKILKGPNFFKPDLRKVIYG